MTWTLVAAVWVAVFAGCVIGWRLRGSVQARRRGGMVDLTPLPRGDLELDWSDSRPLIRYEYKPATLHEFGPSAIDKVISSVIVESDAKAAA